MKKTGGRDNSYLRAPAWACVGFTALLAALWDSVLAPPLQVSAFLAAATFSCIEYTWYSVTTEQPDGQLRFTPGQSTSRAGHTTWEQFFANVLYTPILLHGYRLLVTNQCLRVLLFPLNIWALEVVEGYGLIACYGFNPAWTYDGGDAFFHGNIKLSFFTQWLGLGFAVELVYDLLLAVSTVVAEEWACAVPCMAAAALLLCTGTYRVERSSTLRGADADEVWAAATDPAAINAEMWPLMRMTFPADVELAPREGPLCSSWLLLLGVLPIDRSRVTVEQLEDSDPAARLFIERSPMLLSMSLWQHTRSVEADESGDEVTVTDELVFKPRGAGVLVAAFVRVLFWLRHANLRRRQSRLQKAS